MMMMMMTLMMVLCPSYRSLPTLVVMSGIEAVMGMMLRIKLAATDGMLLEKT